jgi:WD40 repeat protein
VSVYNTQMKPVKQRSKRPFVILGIILILILALLLCTNVNNDLQFVIHFLAPPDHFTYNGHSDAVSSVAWSPTGKRIASASSDGTVQVWDAGTGKHILTYRGHTSGVLAVTWSHNGTDLASGGSDNTVQIWNASTGAHVLIYRGHTTVVTSVAWSPDDRSIASCDINGIIQVWQTSNGKLLMKTSGPQVARGEPVACNSVAWSPDGTKIAVGESGNVIILNAATGQALAEYGNSTGTVNSVSWSPDGTEIAFSQEEDILQIWNVSQIREVSSLTGQAIGDIYAVAWSPNGKMIATANADGVVEVWNPTSNTGKPIYIYRGHADLYPGHLTIGSGFAVNGIAWSPNSAKIASASNDKTVQVWQA